MHLTVTKSNSWCRGSSDSYVAPFRRGYVLSKKEEMTETITRDLTIVGARELLASGSASSRELVQDLLSLIRECDGEINAYVSVDEDSALEQADAADKLRGDGGQGLLLGVPVAVKDILNVKGQPCSCCSRILNGYRSPYDATVIGRIRAAGGVLLGRTNMDEFAMGSTTENSAFKVTKNPWNLNCVPGGSSGGSAAAVAAGEAIAALGSDTGGSVRQPAAFCGCVGLKPSYGRVSRYGLTAYASSLDQVGTLTKDVRDAAVLLGIIAGHDLMDSTSVNAPVPEFDRALSGDLRGVKIGLPEECFAQGMDPEVERLVRKAVGQCECLGAELVDVRLEMTRHAVAAYYIIACAEASANLARFDGVRYGAQAAEPKDPFDMYCRTRAMGFGAEVKRRIILGTYVLSSGYYEAYYGRAQKIRTLIRHDFDQAFSKCDVLLTPVAPTAAYRIGEKTLDPLQMYLGDIFTAPANLAGICGLSVPCGFVSSGLPVGLQALGPAFREDVVLKVGYAYEQAAGWRCAKPRAGTAGE